MLINSGNTINYSFVIGMKFLVSFFNVVLNLFTDNFRCMQENDQSTSLIREENNSFQHAVGSRPKLSLQIPPRSISNGSTSSLKVNLPPTPSTAKSKTPIRGFPPRPSFKNKASTSEGENNVLLTPEASSKRLVPEVENKVSYLRSYSLKKVLAAFSANKSSSLPVTRDAKLSPSTSQLTHGVKAADQPPAVVSICSLVFLTLYERSLRNIDGKNMA